MYATSREHVVHCALTARGRATVRAIGRRILQETGGAVDGTTFAGCFRAESCHAVIALAYVMQMSLIVLAHINSRRAPTVWSKTKDVSWLSLRLLTHSFHYLPYENIRSEQNKPQYRRKSTYCVQTTAMGHKNSKRGKKKSHRCKSVH